MSFVSYGLTAWSLHGLTVVNPVDGTVTSTSPVANQPNLALKQWMGGQGARSAERSSFNRPADVEPVEDEYAPNPSSFHP